MTLLQSWNGKQILLPNNPVFTIGGNDTVSFPIRDGFKILHYVDSVGCVSCKLQLADWVYFMEYMDSCRENSTQFLFFFSPEKLLDIHRALHIANFKYPICIDNKDSLDLLNNFPLDAAFHTFLLDRNNKVVAVGNPIHNPKVKDLYLKIIQGEKVGQRKQNKEIRTQVDIDKTSVSLGTFNWQKERSATFVMKNVGNKPLVIQDVNTSCGCTTVTYSKEPVQPGKELKLDVTYKADHPEYFSKTITVYCNIEASPIRLTISGNAE